MKRTATTPKPMGLNLAAARQSKWLGGVSATFIGIECSGAYGVAWLSKPKRLRVLMSIASLLAATSSCYTLHRSALS
mgnify:CR=1 FL=1